MNQQPDFGASQNDPFSAVLDQPPSAWQLHPQCAGREYGCALGCHPLLSPAPLGTLPFLFPLDPLSPKFFGSESLYFHIPAYSRKTHIHWLEESFYISVKQFLGHFALHKSHISKLITDIIQLFDGFLKLCVCPAELFIRPVELFIGFFLGLFKLHDLFVGSFL